MPSTQDIDVAPGSAHSTCKALLHHPNFGKRLSRNFELEEQCGTRCCSCCSADERSLLLSCGHHQSNNAFQNYVFCHKWRTDNFLLHHNPCSSLQYLFSRLQPSKVLFFSIFFFSLFMFCVDSAPTPKNYSSRLQTQAKQQDFALDPGYLRPNSAKTFVPTSFELYRAKRSSTDNRNNSVKEGRRKKRKNRKSKPSDVSKKRKRKQKARKKTRKNGFKKPLVKNTMHSITDNRMRLAWSSPRWQRLYNSNGNSFHLAVWPNGTVGGEPSEMESNYSILELRALEGGGIVTIKGYASNRYVCVIKKRVKAKKRFNRARCQFKERVLSNSQNTYESLSCNNCFLNLNKHGKIKKLNGVKPQLPRAHFLPRDQQSKRSRALGARRESAISIDFSKLNETELNVEMVVESFADLERNGLVNRKYNPLITVKKTKKHKASPEKNKFQRHSNPRNWLLNLQRDTDKQTVNIRKIKIKTAEKID